MAESFSKLFSSILESTIWQEPDHVRLLWIAMLAMCNRKGEVYGSIPGLANRARITIPQVEDALARFMSPDPYSRTKDFEGRRIQEIEGGWLIINYAKHRKVQDEEAIKESKRDYMRRIRAEEGDEEETPTSTNSTVEDSGKNASASASEGIDRGTGKEKGETPLPFQTQKFAEAWALWRKYKKQRKQPLPDTTVESQFRKLAKMGERRAIAAIEHSIESGYTGLFEPKGTDSKNGRSAVAPTPADLDNLEREMWAHELSSVNFRAELERLQYGKPKSLTEIQEHFRTKYAKVAPEELI